MTVLHLHRPTRFSRHNMSAANMLCAEYPLNQEAHMVVWGIISKYPSDVDISVLRLAVKNILKK